MPRRSIGFEVPTNVEMQLEGLQEKVEAMDEEIKFLRNENRDLKVNLSKVCADLSARIDSIESLVQNTWSSSVQASVRGVKRKLDSTKSASTELPDGRSGQSLVPPQLGDTPDQSQKAKSQGASNVSSRTVLQNKKSGASLVPRGAHPKTRNGNVTMLVEEANKLSKRFCYLSNPSCPAHVRSMYEEAVQEGNNIAALIQLARLEFGVETLHPHGKRIAKNIEKARRILAKLKRHPQKFSVKSELLVLEGDILQEEYELDMSLAFFEEAAEYGDVDGTFKVGRWHFEKVSEEEDQDSVLQHMDLCLQYLTNASEAGSGPAAALLGYLYENPNDCPLWDDAVLKLERRKTKRKAGTKELGKLGKTYRLKKAGELYQMSAKRQCAKGYNDLACCFQLGSSGFEKDFLRAVENFQLAFEHGYAPAADNLGLLYDPDVEEFKTQSNPEKALRWYVRGSKVHCPTATLHLAQTYDHGKLVNRDAAKAISLYRNAKKLADEAEDSEQAEDAHNDLFKILCTWALVEEDRQAIKEVQDSRTLERVREETTRIVAGKLLPAIHKGQRTTQDTLKDLTRLLGEANTSHLLNYITFLCERVKRPGGKRVDLKRKLHRFVSDDRIRNEIAKLLSS